MHFCATKELSSIQRAVGVRKKYWDVGETIKIAFIGGTTEQQDLVKKESQEWLKYANLRFLFVDSLANSDVRVAFIQGAGAWSYVGVDCLNIPKNQPTMNFGWLDAAVIYHEFGHMLGLGHEHQNPTNPIDWNIANIVKDLSGPPNYWNRSDIQHNILNRYDPSQVDTTVLDKDSIMMYQIPQHWTNGDFKTKFNTAISETDRLFVQGIYSFPNTRNPEIELLRYIFGEKKELRKLQEETIVRIGIHFGLSVDTKLNKRHNVAIVARHLNIE